MKKFLIAIFCGILSLLMLFSTACGKSDFTYTDMLNPGKVDKSTLGGFVFETENYAYFINGEGKSSEDNTFGAPIKGSLVAVQKDTIGTSDMKLSIVVPKLFVASDKLAGLYVYGEGENAYVYYGTPCTDKDSSGDAASSYMTFMRTSLNGKKTDEFITVPALSYEYRIVENAGVVYIVYYDVANSQVVSYNTSTKTQVVVCKTDATTNKSITIDGAKYYLSMNSYKFASDVNGFNVLYTLTAYSEKYYEEKASKEDYARKTAKFNLLATYTVGDEKIEGTDFYGKLVVDLEDAKEDNSTYAITQVQKGASEEFAFFTKTDINSNVKNYGVSKADIHDKDKWEEVEGADKVSSSSILVDLDELYYVDTEAQVIYKTTLTGDKFIKESKIATESEASTLLFIENGYIYYYTSGNKIACYEIPKENELTSKNQIAVSEDIVATTWFSPELVKVGEKAFMLYCDNSSAGASYIKCLDINDKSNIAVDDDKDGNAESYAFSNHVSLGIRLDADVANDAILAINKIETGEIKLTEKDNGELYSEKLENAISVYNGLTDAQKEFVGEEYLTIIEDAKQVVKLANLYNKLKGVENYDEMSADKKATFKTSIEKAYENAKAFRQELLDNGTYIAVRDRVSNNLKYFYQKADSIFTSQNA